MHLVYSKGLLSSSNVMNLFRGCLHGCIYCDSRSKCYGFDHDFEDIEIKSNAPEILLSALSKKRKPCMISTGSMCDSYIPLNDCLEMTHRCIEIIDRFGFGLSVLSKSDLILRDLCLLKSINSRSKCVVQMTLTTADDSLCKIIEPNVCPTSARFRALQVFKDNNIPTIVWISPLLPFINDSESNMMSLLRECFNVGVKGIICFGIGLTLREGCREFFYKKLDESFPGLKDRYIRSYGNSYFCCSPNHDSLMHLFHDECEKHGVMHDSNQIFSYIKSFPEPKSPQLSLF